MANKRPTLLIFAGANGAGKSTLAEHIIPQKASKDFINTDEIARGLSPFDPDSQRISAGRIALRRRQECLNQGKDFSIESTLSGHDLVPFLIAARQKNYEIRLYYAYIADVQINIERVKERVKQGGHNVPVNDIRRRYTRSLENLFHLYYPLCDIIGIYDNTGGEPTMIAYKGQDGQNHVHADHTESWQTILRKAKMRDHV